MRVDQIMTDTLVTCGPDDELRAIRGLFERARFHHLLVMEGSRLRGIISDRDLLRHLSPFAGSLAERAQDAATLRKRAHQLMSRAPVTVQPEASVEEAVRLILGKKVSALPVVTAAGRLVGILTWRDILSAGWKPRA